MIMEHNVTNIEKLYDRVAREYAERFSDEHEKKPKGQEMLKRFAQAIGSRRPAWDIGCGPGQTTRYLTNLGIEISGLDLSGKLLKLARMLHPDIHFRKGNILELEFTNDSIAGAIAFYTMVHFSEAQVRRACREVFRVLQPGGVLLLAYHIGEKTIYVEEFLGKKVAIDFMFFTTDFISHSLQKSGFNRIEIIEREPYPRVEYESRRAYVFAIKPATR